MTATALILDQATPRSALAVDTSTRDELDAPAAFLEASNADATALAPHPGEDAKDVRTPVEADLGAKTSSAAPLVGPPTAAPSSPRWGGRLSRTEYTAGQRRLWDRALATGAPLPTGAELSRATGGAKSLGRRNANRWRKELPATANQPPRAGATTSHSTSAIDHPRDRTRSVGPDTATATARGEQFDVRATAGVSSSEVAPVAGSAPVGDKRRGDAPGAATAAWAAPPTRDWATDIGIAIVGVAAAVSSWAGWVGLALMAGWTQSVGLGDTGVRLWLAWLLPIAVDVYALVAARVWMRLPWVSPSTRSFARWTTLATVALGVAANVVYHVSDTHSAGTASHTADLSLAIVVATASLPPLMLGAVAHLSALMNSDRLQTRATPR
jgi:hypothetical protein